MEDIDYIKLLLERFYNGSTTIDEEAELISFFSDCKDVPKELEADKTLFDNIQLANALLINSISMPVELTKEIEARVDAEAKKSIYKPFWNWQRLAISVAVCACIIALLIPFMKLDNNNNSELYPNPEYSNLYIPQSEEAATVETSRALMLISSKLNQGSTQVEYITTKTATF
ncbi:MAG: hypothetical protein E7080_10085 [Bacteroidales bacterium]|nr:hypothetical protein [Bacteroidales bacterium]